jgi:hypothetical protein
MKKRNGWKWLLGFTVLAAMSTVSSITSPMYDEMVRWPISAAFTVSFAVAAYFIYRKEKAEESAAAAKIQARTDAERKQREEREAAVKAFQERYIHEKFPVAGVTFQNDDKTDRQKILLEISFNERAETSAWLEEEAPELGEESGIRVMTDYGCVGYIRRSDKPLARRFEGKTICTSYLSVEQFTNDEGRSIYRADIVFVIDRKSPNQQWYFDDLPER